MFQKYICTLICLLVFLTWEVQVFAESKSSIYRQEMYVENLHNVHLRSSPGIHESKTYIVMKWIQGKVLDEKKVDNLTWIYVSYNEHISWWIHKKLTHQSSISYTLTNGTKYNVYFSDKKEPIYLASESGDIITSEITGENEEIIWITTNFRTEGSIYTKRPWDEKYRLQYIDSINVDGNSSTFVEPIVNNFRTDSEIKVHYPWNIPEVIVDSLGETISAQEKIMMVTTNMRTPSEIKVSYPWLKDQFTYTSGTTDEAKEPEIQYNSYNFRKWYEIKVHYPWVKEVTYLDETTWSGETVIEKVVSIITNTFRTDEPIHMKTPWIKESDILSDSEGVETETGASLIQSYTSILGPEKPAGWTLHDFID